MRRSILVPGFLLLLVCGLFWLRVLRQPAPQRAPRRWSDAVGPKSGQGTARPAARSVAAQTAGLADGEHPRKWAVGTELLTAGWGGRPGELGRRHDPESNPEVPMALTIGADGELAILDQVNRRVERYRGGRRLSGIQLGGDTAQDLALGPEGRTVLLDRMVDRNLQVYDPAGRLLNEVPLDGQSLPAAATATAVFADDSGIYVEREHGTVVRVADPNGNVDRPPEELAGRPTRDGQLLVAAALLDPQSGLLTVRAVQRATGQPAWTQTVELGAPALHLLLLDSDRRGRVYLAAATGHEATTPPFQILDESIIAVQLGSGGVERSRLTLPPLPAADETFRPLTVDDEGALLVMSTQPNGLVVTRYLFP